MESQIEAADTLELEGAMGKLLGSGHSGGEMVDQGDLWRIVEQEVGRHLRATAAEGRQNDNEID